MNKYYYNFEDNYKKTKKLSGYIDLNDAVDENYHDLGFKCGLEVHQQIKTKKKLFCRCPAGIYHDKKDYDAEVIRHMRPTLSELGEYDGTALMEFKTKKNITYRIKNQTTCTYEIDDTPPFPINREALKIALEIALLLKTSIVGELHITRKQYLDGSIPTGFQRTAIIGINGILPIKNKNIKILQISIEEDACREISDFRHERIYTTDRLGIPLIETVTYPDINTPSEAVETGQYIRFMNRSTGKVRKGIGTTREDVNVSITGGTRVEIKGVAHIKWFKSLVHNEAFRQKSLLKIKEILIKRVIKNKDWKLTYIETDEKILNNKPKSFHLYNNSNLKVIIVNLPCFKDILSFFTQPGKIFADEISGRLKVIACLEQPNMIHSEDKFVHQEKVNFSSVSKLLSSKPEDAQIVFWAPEEDIKTAIETIEERCKLAIIGVPNETRKALPDGTTIFERVLPGPDRMYPDTDSAPIPINQETIDNIERELPVSISKRYQQLIKWRIPEDAYTYILRNNLIPIIENIINDFDFNPKFVATTFAHSLKNIEGKIESSDNFKFEKIYDIFKYVYNTNLDYDIIKTMLPVIYKYPKMDMESVLISIGHKYLSKEDICSNISSLSSKFKEIQISNNPDAELKWILGNLNDIAIGNISLRELRNYVEIMLKND